MAERDKLLHCCLYFTASSLSRAVTRMADEEFRVAGLSPSHAFLVMVVLDDPGIAQKDLGEALALAPSTITRFVDALSRRGFVERRGDGKSVRVYPSKAAHDAMPAIRAAWERLFDRYSAILGHEEGIDLTRRTDEAAAKLAAESARKS